MHLLLMLVVFCFAVLIWRIRDRRYLLPPGPPADPIVGHFRQLPSEKMAEKLYEWGKLDGDVMRLWVPGQTIIVLNSHEAATALLDKRSSKFSSRPAFRFYKMLGWECSTIFLPYGRELISQRKMLNHYLYQQKTREYFPFLVIEARSTLSRLLSHGEQFLRYAATTLIRVAYGHEVASDEDSYLTVVKEGIDVINSLPAANTPLDVFPILNYLPSWFPGTYWAIFSRRWCPTVLRFHYLPYQDVLQRLVSSVAQVQPSGGARARNFHGFVKGFLNSFIRQGAREQC